MSWPVNPVNGQRVQINGVLYEFNAANETWDKVGGYPDNIIAEFVQTPNLIVTDRATFTDAGNVKIQGGFDGYVLTTDGLGNLTWEPQSTLTAAGADTEVQFKTNDALDSSPSFTFNKTTGTLSVPKIQGSLTSSAQPNITSVGTITDLNVAGNIVAGNKITASSFVGNFSGNFTGNFVAPGSTTQLLLNSQGNIAATNKITFDNTTLDVTGNIKSGNANLGNLVTANFINATLTVAQQPNITRLGTLVNLTSSGNITAPNFVGNLVGGNISGNFVAPGSNTHMLLNYQGNIAATSNITFGDGLMNVAGNIHAANISAVSDISATTLTGSLKTASQPNITSLGTLTGLNVTGHATISGNVTAANLRGNVIGGTITGSFSAPGNPTEVVYNKAGTLGTSSNLKFDGETLTVIGNTVSGNVYANSGTIGASSLVGTITTATQTNITRVGTLVNASVTGNVVAGNVYANSGTIGASLLTGTLTTAAQPNITSVGTLTSLTATGNITTSANLTGSNAHVSRVFSNVYTAPNNSSNTQILYNNEGTIDGSSSLTFNGTILNVASNVNAANITASNVTATLLTGTLTTSAQPNITSVGLLSNLDVDEDLNVGNNVIANTIIANRIETDVIMGQLTAPAGLAANKQILFNLDGVVESNNKLQFNPIGTATLTLIGNLTTGNANLGNTLTANYIQGSILPVSSSQPNITTVGTLTSLSVDGPINIANSSITLDNNSYIVGNLIPVTSPTSATDTFTGDGVQTLFVLSVLPYPGDIITITINGVTEDPLNYTILNKDLTFNTAPAVGAAIVVQMQLNTPIYDLGSPSARWRDLWLSGTTIKLGTATITSTDTGTIDTGGGEFQSEVLTSTATDIAPFIVYSSVMVGNLNVQYLQGFEPSTSNLANTIVLRNEFHNFEANVITARLEGNATRSNTVIDAAQPNITSVGLLTHLDVDETLTAANILLSSNITAEYFKGSGAELYNINGANVSEVPLATFATDAQDAVFAVDAQTAQFAVTVTGCAQPAITSVGTLTSLKVTNKIEAGEIDASLGNVYGANFFGGNVSGNISGIFRAPGGTASNTEVLFNKEGNIGGSEGFKFNSLVNSLTITGKFNSKDANLGNLVEANYFKGEGNNLSNIRGANVNGEVAFAATANAVAGANVSGQVGNALVSGTVYTAAQPNITSLGTLTGLVVSRPSMSTSIPILLQQVWNNADVAFTQIRSVSYDSSSAAESLLIDLQTHKDSTFTSRFKVNKVGNLTTGNIIAGNIEATVIKASQPFITSLGTLNELTVASNIYSGNAQLGNLVKGNYFQGDGSLLINTPPGNRLQNGTSNVVVVQNGNVNISIEGTNDVLTIGNVSGTFTSNFKGNLNTSGNANLGNLVTANFFAGNANNLFNIVGANVTGTVANATHACTANVVTNATQTNITRLGTLTELTLSSIADPSLGNNATASFFTGTLTTAAQPNITSVGRLTSLTVGNLTANTRFGNGTIQAAGNIDGANINGNLYGNGSGISYLNGSVVNGDVPSAATAITAGTVLSSSQPNITSVNTSSGLTSLKVSGESDFIGNVIIRSNLTVQGTTITANATTMNIRDPIIQIGGNTSGGALPNDDGKDRGILLHYHNGVNPVDGFMGWDNDLEQFTFSSKVSITNEVVTHTELGNIRASYFLGNGSQLEGLPPPNEIFKGTSNVKITDLDGNVTISANSVTNIVTIFGNRGGSIGNGMTVVGNVNATRFFGDGSQLTGVTTTSISNGSSNVSASISGGNITMGVGGVANVFQIDSVGNVEIKGLLKTGTGSGGNITGANVVSANTFIGNLANGTSNIRITQNGNVGISANGVSNTVIISGGLANVLTVAGNIDIGSNWFRGNGALLSGISTSSISNGTSNVNIPAAAGNVNISVGGTANILAVSSSGINVIGSANVTSQLISTVATGTAPLQVTSTTRVTNLNVAYANVSDFEAVTIATTGTYYPTFINGITAGNYAAFANSSLSFNAATGALSASSFVGTATGPLANGTSNVSIASSGGNVTISAGGTANVLTVTSTGILGTFINSSDIITTYATNAITHDYNTSSVLYVSGATGTLSLNFGTSIPTTTNRAIVIPVIIAHGATAMTYPTSITIGGVSHSINYIQGTTPTARTNKTEVLGLTLIRTPTPSWVVLGSVSSYG